LFDDHDREAAEASHARKLIIRLGPGAEALGLIISARQTIRALACGPAGYQPQPTSPGAGLCRQPPDREAMPLYAHRSGFGLAVVAKSSNPDPPAMQPHPTER
jgi:hypothetical protein